MEKRLKKRVILGVIVVLSGLIFMTVTMGATKGQETYLKINQKSIGKDEIYFIVSSMKSSVISQVQGKYGLAYNESFWDTQVDDTTPRNILEEKVIETLVRNTVIEELLSAEGILQYDSFEAFNKLLVNVNEMRKKAVANKEVIYGPIEYSQFDYYNYLMANNLITLRERYMASEKVELTDDRLRAYEQSHPELIHTEAHTLNTDLIYMKFVEEDGTINAHKEQLYFTSMNEIYRLLEEGKEIEELLKLYPDLLSYEAHLFTEETERQDMNSYGNLMEALNQVKEGAFTPVTRDNGAYYIGILNKKEEGDKRPFEEYRDFLAIKYTEEWIQNHIDTLAATAEVQILKSLIE
ncbi:peptidylprolyl isomerase [Niameybacter massiliensis]|uniref:peptidylprolyl isomerase n=1 Tax=Niameybacter massiliensis TaxID=1658108 RepID=UPI0006B40A17|nr:peptidylprolyl isomerase [Niameybacter massiliensis]